MNRDFPRLTGEQDGEAEIFSALWAAAPSFPQLPSDATPELKAFTVDVEDPKRVYSLYRASRRHGYQVLVERYINQLRYGCQEPRCSTPTCFTCRRRLAGSTPVRRYNATSARTLACYLASKDNPEKGLCQYASTSPLKKPAPARLCVSNKGSITLESPKSVQRARRSPKDSTQNPNHDIGPGQGLYGSISVTGHITPEAILKDPTGNDGRNDVDHVCSVVRDLEQPVKKDHKSFIQNLFGTVAFRMLEWLTPKNLESMVVSDTHNQDQTALREDDKLDEPFTHQATKLNPVEDTPFIEVPVEVEGDNQTLMSPNQLSSDMGSPDDLHTRQSYINSGHTDRFDVEKNRGTVVQSSNINTSLHQISCEQVDCTSPLSPKTHMNGSSVHDIQDRGALEFGISKSARINGQTVQPEDSESQKTLDSQGILPAKKARKRLSSLSNTRPSMGFQDSIPHHEGPQSPVQQSARRTSVNKITPSSDNDNVMRVALEESTEVQVARQDVQPFDSRPSPPSHVKVSPQSLSVLSLEVVELISEISRGDEIQSFVGKFATLPSTEVCLQRPRRSEALQSAKNNDHFLLNLSARTAPMWKLFIEQSLYYVLSSPKALLESFSEGEQSLLDTQTLWYSLMRLINVNSSVVFDSLWIAAADLYPPRELWPVHDWVKKSSIPETERGVDYSVDEAARLLSIYLHALIAAVPYTRDSAQLFAISRIRSCGVSSPQRRGLPPESIDIYLRTDDVFSDELILRLARRVFAAIPARRQYQELIGPSESGSAGQSSLDILELVLKPLNFLDIEVPPVLAFTAEDREIHEKRAPTLMIDWARTIMLVDWAGQAEVSAEGAFGGALAMISAIYDKRKSLLLGDVHFRTEYFADRLDSMDMPVEWLSFTPNKKTLHLLDHPYLFSPANLVTYFRAINFSRMSRSFEASNSMLSRIHSTMAPETLMTDAGRREDLFERLRTAVSKFLVLQISRSDVLSDAFNHLWRREQRELSRPLKVKLGEDSGEEGSDSGGVQQEFFRLAIAEALNPDYGTFTIDDRTRMTWFQPGSPQPLWKFELIGLIISLAVYNGLTLPVTFPKALYRKLLGRPVTELHHIEDGWPDLASGLTSLLEWDEKDGSVSDVFSRTYEFSIDSFGKPISRDMSAGTKWPQFNEESEPNPVDARLVDNENRNEYVSDYILWLTDISIHPQFEAFRQGFLTCLDCRSLSLFDPDILQSVVEGVQEIDISELRRYARYVGWDATHRTIKDFWSIVKKFDTDEKKKLLEFVTASDRVPVGGMRNLQFVVQRNGVGDIDGHLPTSYTCYGTLLLPEYSSKDILKEKLGMALENAKGFGFA